MTLTIIIAATLILIAIIAYISVRGGSDGNDIDPYNGDGF